MVARMNGSSWEVAVEALHWKLLQDRHERQSDEEGRQWYGQLKENNVSLAFLLASQLSWLPG